MKLKTSEVFHHTCLRAVLNIASKGKMRKETIRKTVGQDMLNTTVEKRQLCWFGHLQMHRGLQKSETG